MNSAQKSRKANLTFFFISIVMSAMLLGAAAYLSKVFLAGMADGEPPSTSTCIAMLSAHGFGPRNEKGSIRSVQALSENIESRVAEVGVVLAYCPSHSIKDFCAGSGCKVPGISFTLEPRK